ncbi:MAG: hypothetical protein SynsKO_37080 [Synoicihabitans sp.]
MIYTSSRQEAQGHPPNSSAWRYLPLVTYYAHTATDENGDLLNPEKWEPLFTEDSQRLKPKETA